MDKYQSVEDFIVDPEFKRWILHPTSNSTLYWEKWIKSHPDKLELFQEARELILSFEFTERKIENKDYEEVLNAIISDDKKYESSKRSNSSNWFYLSIRSAAAITLILLAYVGYNFLSGSQKTIESAPVVFLKENPEGQKSRFRLPDGTKVWLNAESVLSYQEQDGRRVALLKGEAYFDVKRDSLHPFEVHSRDLITTALGTSFNVSAYLDSDEIKVQLVSGKVLVKRTGNEALNQEILVPDEMAVYQIRNRQLFKTNIRDKKWLAWKDGLLYFKDAGLEEVVHELERWYGVSIAVVNRPNSDWLYNGEFKNEDLETVLKRMAFVESFEFQINNNEIIMDFKKH